MEGNSNKKKASKQTEKIISQRTKNRMNKMLGNSGKLQQKEKTQQKPLSTKSQALANKIKQENKKQTQKQKVTEQNKKEFNLNRLVNKENLPTKQVEGIVKKFDPTLQSVSKNNSTAIKANVIGKKSDIKIIGNKLLITVSVVLCVFFIVSLVSNFLLYSYFKFQSEQPLITITKPIELQLNSNTSSLASITVPRHILPNSTVSQEVVVKTLTVPYPLAVRLKGVFTSGDGEVLPLEMTVNDEWQNGEDGYYYLTRFLITSDVQTCVEEVTIPQNFTLSINGKNMHTITFVLETTSYQNATLLNWAVLPTA